MKKVKLLYTVLILLLLTLLSNCSNKESEEPKTNTIIGKWQLIERFDGGSVAPFQSVENGEIISFDINSIYSNDTFYACDGSYTVKKEVINIHFPCINAGFDIGLKYSFKNTNLILSSTPTSCFEGCYDIYKRIE